MRDAFTVVRWPWVVAAVGAQPALGDGALARLEHGDPPGDRAAPRPGFRLVFSAFCVGLFANAVLPGRVGEIGRAAVLARRLPGRKGVWATLIGTVFAHRMFDLFPTIGLVVWVLLGAKLPHWALMTIIVVLGIGLALFAFAVIGAREHGRVLDGQLGRVRSLLTRARVGLAIMREPLAAAAAPHLPVPRLVLPAARGLRGDAGLPDPPAARRRRARAADDERRHGVPVLARQHRARAGGDRGRRSSSTASTTARASPTGSGCR